MRVLCASASTDENAGKPIMLCGPVGCGKSYGLARVLRLLDMKAQVLDPSSTLDDIRATLRTMHHRHLGGRFAFVLDGISSFHPDAIQEIREKTASMKGGSSATRPVLIGVCVDAFDLRITSLRFFYRIQLYAPNEQQMRLCLEREYSSVSCTTLQSVIQRSQGDFRSAVRLLADRFLSSRKDRTDGMYGETRKLLLGNISADEWERQAVDRDSGSLGPYTMLLFHNHLDFTESLDQVCEQADALSLAATCSLNHRSSMIKVVSNTFYASRAGSSGERSQITLRFPKSSSLTKPERLLPYTDTGPLEGRTHGPPPPGWTSGSS